MSGRTVQIDVKGLLDPSENIMDCRLYTGDRCVKIFMSKYDYENLILDGFFIRDGKSLDSADILNTTNNFIEQK